MCLQAAVTSLGGLDHVYLNHAVLPQADHPMWPDARDSLLDYFERAMNVNTNSYVFLYTAAFPHLLKSSDARVAVTGAITGQCPAIKRMSLCHMCSAGMTRWPLL